jgi:hypothetical protein
MRKRWQLRFTVRFFLNAFRDALEKGDSQARSTVQLVFRDQLEAQFIQAIAQLDHRFFDGVADTLRRLDRWQDVTATSDKTRLCLVSWKMMVERAAQDSWFREMMASHGVATSRPTIEELMQNENLRGIDEKQIRRAARDVGLQIAPSARGRKRGTRKAQRRR